MASILGNIFEGVRGVVAIGLLCAIALVLLANLGTTSALGNTASKAINDTATAIATVPTNWLGLIVLFIIMAVLFALAMGVVGSLGGNRR